VWCEAANTLRYLPLLLLLLLLCGLQIKLRLLFPSADVSQMISRRPTLLLDEEFEQVTRIHVDVGFVMRLFSLCATMFKQWHRLLRHEENLSR
jgi:hypothetical protein